MRVAVAGDELLLLVLVVGVLLLGWEVEGGWVGEPALHGMVGLTGACGSEGGEPMDAAAAARGVDVRGEPELRETLGSRSSSGKSSTLTVIWCAITLLSSVCPGGGGQEFDY